MNFATSHLDPSAAREIIARSGVSVAEWARANGFSSGLVYQVLRGRRKCLRGQSYAIAIALGVLPGEAINVAGLNEKLKAARPMEQAGHAREEG